MEKLKREVSKIHGFRSATQKLELIKFNGVCEDEIYVSNSYILCPNTFKWNEEKPVS